MHSDDFARREAATRDLLASDIACPRCVVIPRLTHESARMPMEVSSVGGSIVRGRVTGGDEEALELEVTDRFIRGAVIRFTFTDIKVIRLFSP